MDTRVSAYSSDICQAIADDALSLVMLHDRELSAETLAMLVDCQFPANLGLLPRQESSLVAWSAMTELVAAMPTSIRQEDLDELAAEYAAIYLTGAYQASPYESVWTDDEHLMCQAAMNDLRAIYSQAGLAVENWRNRPDDHFVFQLLYIAHQLQNARDESDCKAVADFMDQHLLGWFDAFVELVGRRSRNPFYVRLLQLTAAWCHEARSVLAPPVQKKRKFKPDPRFQVAVMNAPGSD